MNFDLVKFIEAAGYAGIIAIIFAESGLFFGFFLPGDSLLLTAGLLASRSVLNLFLLLPLVFVAAVLGDNVGYWFGKKVGPPLFTRDNSLFFRRKNLLAAKDFYAKHGGKAILLARFMPFIRTFTPIVAGAVEMEYRRFFTFNLLGGLLWSIGVTLVGYGIGRVAGNVEGIDNYFLALVVIVIIVSAMPAVIHIWRENRHEIFAAVRTRIGRSSE